MRHRSHVPWWLPDEDLVEADDGEVAFQRDTMIRGRAERQLALHVVGQFDRGMSLGLVAIRCERKGGHVIPLTLSIPEDAVIQPPTDAPKYWWLSGAREETDDDGA